MGITACKVDKSIAQTHLSLHDVIQTIKPLCLPSSQNLKGPRSTGQYDSRAPQSPSPAQRPSDRCQVGFQQLRVPFVCES